jgi:D-glycero-alpha-D-manno-heptose-7-phosphate kinase
MIICRTPLRISFFGGGTDYPVWYKKNKGSVISTSINKYIYVTCRYLPHFFNYNYRIRYTEQEHVKRVSQIKHPSVRECLKYLKFKGGLEMQHNADIPAMSGMGSSSAFTVGLLNALYGLQGTMIDKRRLALEAIHVEQNLIKENVGAQDQTIAAYGGLNRIDFGDKEIINVTPINIKSERLNKLEGNLMMFFTGITRNASKIAKSQIKATNKKTADLNKMLDLVEEAYKVLTKERINLDDFGALLDESWKIKRTLTNKISSGLIDEFYENAIKAGAIGGKLLGAGSGGCMVFYVKKDKQESVRRKLKNLLYIPIKFENFGSQIIYKMPSSY